jgi:zinc transport system permease protein
VLGAVLIELVRARGRTSGDVALAVLFYGGIAGGVVLLSLAPRGEATNLDAYLFGAITTTTTADVALFAVITVVVLGIVWLLGQRLYAVSDDEEYARAVGLPVLALNVVLAALVAATVVLSMRVVGLLLISALMIVPSAVAQQLARSFRQTLYLACAIGLVTSVAGTTASYYTGTPSGGTIVLLAIALFLLATSAVAGREATARRRHRRRAEVHAAHPHEHGDRCGHPAVPHGDHVDYDHDGHLHAPHRTGSGVHYDEHGEHAAPPAGTGGRA